MTPELKAEFVNWYREHDHIHQAFTQGKIGYSQYLSELHNAKEKCTNNVFDTLRDEFDNEIDLNSSTTYHKESV